jgi:hypothetical protein
LRVAYRFQPVEVLLGGELAGAADGDDLLPGAVLPLGVHGQEHGGPGQKVGGRLLAGEEEGLALLHHVLHRHRLRLLVPGIDHQPQQVLEAAVVALVRFVFLGGVAAPADEPD